ncbi:MAG: PASTA domain-containing protein, partial [Deltaproteobacteria bacterium]
TVKAATPPAPPYTRGGSGGLAHEDVLVEAAPVGPGVPDFTGKTVRAVLKLAQEKSIEVEIAGSGKAISQSLTPGRSIPSSARVKVFFR